jgi:hypothetical protein
MVCSAVTKTILALRLVNLLSTTRKKKLLYSGRYRKHRQRHQTWSHSHFSSYSYCFLFSLFVRDSEKQPPFHVTKFIPFYCFLNIHSVKGDRTILLASSLTEAAVTVLVLSNLENMTQKVSSYFITSRTTKWLPPPPPPLQNEWCGSYVLSWKRKQLRGSPSIRR